MLNTTTWTTVTYMFNGAPRTARAGIVEMVGKPTQYNFSRTKGRPFYLSKVDGQWLVSGTHPLTESEEGYEVLIAVVKAIEEQLM